MHRSKTARVLLLTAIFAGCGILRLLVLVTRLRADDAPRITEKAVWDPTPKVLSDIRQVCAGGDPSHNEACFLDSMKAAGASQQAQDFVKAFAPGRGLAYLRAFRDTGKVDIAYIEYLFRANELDGVLLVNGTPPFIDVDDDKITSQEEYSKTPDFAALKKKHPQVSIWPGDRYQTNLPTEDSSGARQAFDVEYLLLNGCHACARIGTAIIKFRFDSAGRLVNTQLVKVVAAAKDFSAPSLPSQDTDDRVSPIHIDSKVGDSFAISLKANHTTGYSWRLAKPLNADLLRKVSDSYQEENSGRTGAGGREVWTFDALAAGTGEIEFDYARPWEKEAAPVNTAKYKFEIK